MRLKRTGYIQRYIAKHSVATLLVLVCAQICQGNSKVREPDSCGAVPTEQQIRWHRMEWYAFVHFGLNTYTGKEWGYGNESPALFNPAHFDADSVVKMCKQAGMKGLIFTAKHHDGFCMWPTRSTPHSISASPWRNGRGDVVADFSDACRQNGLLFGVYLSPWDRNNAHYGRREYLKVYEDQIREILTNYGSIFEIWFDGANGGDGFYGGSNEIRNIGEADTYYNYRHIVTLVRKLKPNCIIWGAEKRGDVMWGGSERGDVQYPLWNVVPETFGSPQEKWLSIEGDTKINEAGWFWHEGQDVLVKSPAQLMQTYFDSVGRGANLILNIALNKQGQVDTADCAVLRAFGEMRRQLLANDYALHASAQASEVRGQSEEFAATKVTDGDLESYWCPEDGTTRGCWVEVRLSEPVSFDVVRVREQIRLGQRVKSFRIEAWIDERWQCVDEGGKTIGNQVLRRLDHCVTAQRVRLTILDSRACPCISEISLLKYPCEIIAEMSPRNSTPEKTSLPRDKWIARDEEAKKAWDGDANTYWQSHENSLVVDLGEDCTFRGFTYLPKQNGDPEGLTDRFTFEISLDGTTWKKVASGEFPNVRADPIPQTIFFTNRATARFFRFTGTTALQGDGASAAEILLIP